MKLPVEDILPALCAHLRDRPNVVLVAPPGAGKTTAVAPALLGEPWCTGQILLLSPRRLAARAAAERIAELMNERVGDQVGYATRMDSKQSQKTRILVLTEGIFRARIQSDPELLGISAVLFDEVHERSLDSDFGLALALDAQGGLRPDLRLLAMSATLEGERFATLMDAPTLESQGRSHPLMINYRGRSQDERIEDAVASAVRRALRDEEGDILAFLPGVANIERAAANLDGIAATIHMLHGTLDPVKQRAALQKSADRKVILATSIAETSLTIDGVRIVIDSGLARRARYDRVAGVTRLVTERASQAAITQRAGRAARQGPGIAYRLWEESATAGMPPFDPPEILEADLSSLLLDCALWGVNDPTQLRWLDTPPEAALSEARARLKELDAIDDQGRPTAHGRILAALPLPLPLAHMLVKAGALGCADLAAEVAVLVSERGVGGLDVDLEHRLDRWRRDTSKRGEAARQLARRWRGLCSANGPKTSISVGVAVALAFPARIVKRRDANGEHWLSLGGRGFRLDDAHPLAKQDWLAVADIQGAASGARILSAAPLALAEIEAIFSDQIATASDVVFDPELRGVRTETRRRLGAITLAKGQDSHADPEAIVAALMQGVRDYGLEQLPWSQDAQHLRSRTAFAGLTTLLNAALLDDAEMWMPPLFMGKRRLTDVNTDALNQAMLDRLSWDERQTVDAMAPPQFISPAGQRYEIDYEALGGPTVELRVQALFGLDRHPVIGPDRTPLILSLTSPAGRPIQTTRDLPSFWTGSWREVVKEMRGRYPKHVWPDDPCTAIASLKTKNALARER